MRFLGIEVPASISSNPEKILKRNKCKDPRASFVMPKQSTSDPTLPYDLHFPGPKKSSHHHNAPKCSQSLPVHVLPGSQYFVKSKSEPTHVEESSKTKTKSKFCSNKYKGRSQSRNKFHYMECGENLMKHDNLDLTSEILNDNMPRSICFDNNQEFSQKSLEKRTHDTKVPVCARSLQKISSMQYLEKKGKGSGETEHEATCLGVASTTETDMFCERTAFYTAPHDFDPYACLSSRGCDGTVLPNNVQACDSVVIAHIPHLPPNRIAHILIKTPSDIAPCKKTIELFAHSDHHTDESDIDVVNSSDVYTLRKCASFTIPSSNSSFIPSSPHVRKK